MREERGKGKRRQGIRWWEEEQGERREGGGEDAEWRSLKCPRNVMKIHISAGNLKIIRWRPQSSGKSDYSSGWREFSSLSPGVVMVKFPYYTSAVFSIRKTAMTQLYGVCFFLLLFSLFIYSFPISTKPRSE